VVTRSVISSSGWVVFGSEGWLNLLRVCVAERVSCPIQIVQEVVVMAVFHLLVVPRF
jgi:hypothetical protein